jgi:ankyrin repeat protein
VPASAGSAFPEGADLGGRGADINQAAETDKTTPLVIAIINGHFDLAKYLLERGADPNAASTAGLTPLYATVDVQWAPHAWYPQPNVTQEKTSYLDLMQALLSRGANPNVRLVKKLWFRGLAQDPTWVDPSGSTAFWRAAQSADTAAMKLLAAHGADPKIANNQGDTPLIVASGVGWMANHSNNLPGGWLAAIKYCVELGADVNAVDSRGYTALHGAAYIGDNDAIRFLVSKGAKIDAKSKAGDTVADMANGPTRFGLPHPETVALLESLGSANSHNCRSDQCLVAPKEDRKPGVPSVNAAPANPAPATTQPPTTPAKGGK